MHSRLGGGRIRQDQDHGQTSPIMAAGHHALPMLLLGRRPSPWTSLVCIDVKHEKHGARTHIWLVFHYLPPKSSAIPRRRAEKGEGMPAAAA